MNKKILLILISFILCFSTIHANSNYSDLALDTMGWCMGKEVKFQIYNKTDYDNIDEIKRELCDPDDRCDYYECELEKNWLKDECEPCDNCLYFHKVENAKITIYDGPMDSRPVLYETTSKEGDFSYTFDTWNEYLVKIVPEEDSNGNKKQHYNDLEETITIRECNSNFEEPKDKIEYFNHNFNYLNSEVQVTITNTTIKNNTEISVRNDVIIPLKLNNSIKTLAITSKNKEFTKIDIKLKYPNNQNAETKLYKYDSKTNNWNQITNFRKEGQYLVLESGELGVYSITQKENKIIPEEPIVEPITEENKTSENGNNEVIKETTTGIQEDKKIETWQIIILVIGIIGLGIIFYLKFGKKNKANYHDERNNEAKTILTTYEQTYQETIKYVEKYKDDYSKDQLYRSLKGSGVPEDIIDKVFNEKL